MKDILAITILQDALVLQYPIRPGLSETVDGQDSLGQTLLEFCSRNSIEARKVVFYVSEELIFYKDTTFPLNTRNLGKTLAYQLEMLTPFQKDEVFYSFTSKRHKDHHSVSLVVTLRMRAEQYLHDIVAVGFTPVGLFPESSRLVPRFGQKAKWALVMPGRFFKVFSFSGNHLDGRYLCGVEPVFDDLAELCNTEEIYHQEPPKGSRFKSAQLLAQKMPALKEFNLLPETFRQPDYFKMAVTALLILNIVALIGVFAMKEITLFRNVNQVEAEISRIMPMVEKYEQLRAREQQIEGDLEKLNFIGSSPDGIRTLEKLTMLLPRHAYLDQLRLDSKERSVFIQGYTDNVGDLTATLQEVGLAKLKSTSRRKDKTYFQMDIALP